MSLKDKLKLAKKANKIEENVKSQVLESNDLSVSGKHNFVSNYDPNEDLKKTNIDFDKLDLSKVKLPKQILESIMRDPINPESYGLSSDLTVNDDITKKLGDGFSRSLEIHKKLMGMDSNNVSTPSTPKQSISHNSDVVHPINNGIDYNYIKFLIKEAMNELKEELLEIQTKDDSPELKLIKLKEDGNLLFLDTDGNIFSTDLVYKGKQKKHS